MTPRQPQIRGLQDDLAQFQKQRDSLQSELDNPALSDRSKDVLRGSMAELGRSIADRRAALNRIESGSD